MKSLSEIETISKRSSRAAGFSWGISEEVAKGVRTLELFGLPGIKNLNQYFKKRKKENFENLTMIKKENKSKKLYLCPIILGVSCLDQTKKIKNFNKCPLEK